jgi:hypothetical protein
MIRDNRNSPRRTLQVPAFYQKRKKTLRKINPRPDDALTPRATAIGRSPVAASISDTELSG